MTNIKKRITGIRQKNMTYKWNFEIKKVKTYLPAVKRIEQRLVFIGTLNIKVRSRRPIASTIKNDHRLKMTVLKCIRKLFFEHSKRSKQQKEIIFLD